MDSKPQSFLTLPAAVIIAGALIAIAIIWIKRPATNYVATSPQAQLADVSMAPIGNSDHILGNPNAQIKIVEYSDPSCPFCKLFNPVMKQIMDQYGAKGQVAWIYRHFPLDKPDADGNILHKNAGHEAQALECAASLGGNAVFWKYEERLYDITPSVTPETPNGLDQKQLPVIAKYVGLDAVAFNSCLESGQFKDKVEKEYLDGINAGVSGTPFVVLVAPSGTKIPLAGAQSYETMKTAINALLSGGTADTDIQ